MKKFLENILFSPSHKITNTRLDKKCSSENLAMNDEKVYWQFIDIL